MSLRPVPLTINTFEVICALKFCHICFIYIVLLLAVKDDDILDTIDTDAIFNKEINTDVETWTFRRKDDNINKNKQKQKQS